MKQSLIDETSGQKVASFKLKEFTSYQDLDIERIDPLDFYVDAYDYKEDPRGCAKIIRTWISPKKLLTSKQYNFLTQEDKDAIIASVGKNGAGSNYDYQSTESTIDTFRNKTDVNRIEVLTFYGDYITSDNKVLTNIKATLVGGRIANAQYSSVNTNRIIYAGYKIDENTHRAIAPLASTEIVNILVNRVTDLFIQNLEDIAVPIILYQKCLTNCN